MIENVLARSMRAKVVLMNVLVQPRLDAGSKRWIGPDQRINGSMVLPHRVLTPEPDSVRPSSSDITQSVLAQPFDLRLVVGTLFILSARCCHSAEAYGHPESQDDAGCDHPDHDVSLRRKSPVAPKGVA